MGGKCCSVQGGLAVQSRIREPEQRSDTLFITEKPPDLDAPTDATYLHLEQSEVETWIETGGSTCWPATEGHRQRFLTSCPRA